MTPNCGESSKRFWPVSFGVWQPVQPSTCVRRLPCAMSAYALVTCAPSKLIAGGCAAEWFSGNFEQAGVAVIAFDRPILRIARSAQRLHRFIGDANGVL